MEDYFWLFDLNKKVDKVGLFQMDKIRESWFGRECWGEGGSIAGM